MGTGLVEASIVAVWVGDVSVTLSAHCLVWDQHPSVPCHTGPVWMVMTCCRDTSLGFINFRNGRPSLVLGDDHSHMGGSDDMKSGVVLVEIVLMWQTSYLCFWD